jgi:hypothetical protein
MDLPINSFIANSVSPNGKKYFTGSANSDRIFMMFPEASMVNSLNQYKEKNYSRIGNSCTKQIV